MKIERTNIISLRLRNTFILINSLIILLLPNNLRAGDVSISLMSTQLGICSPSCQTYGCKTGCQGNWWYYDAGDAPEGGYFVFLGETNPFEDATINLGQTINPGTYYVFVKALGYLNTRTYTVDITAGGGSVTVPLNSSDWNGRWTERAELKVTNPTDTIKVRFSVDQVVYGTKVLFTGLYLTDDPKEVVLSSDVVTNLTYPTVMDDSSPVKGNILENSSFETGIGYGWGQHFGWSNARSSFWTNESAFHGNYSIKLPGYSYFTSRVLNLKPNKKYTLSFWIRGESNGANGKIMLTNTFSPPSGFPARHVLSKSFTVSTNWQRVSLTGYVLKYPTSDYNIEIFQYQNPPTNFFIDAIQLEEGDLTDYQPKKPVEIGLVIDKPGNVYYEDEPIIGELRVFNSSAQAVTKQIHYQIFDYLNQKIVDSSITVDVSGNSVKSTNLNISPGKRGIFRIVLWINDEDGTEEEVAFSVVPRPAVVGVDESSYMGVHPQFFEAHFETLQRLGIKWARVMSPANFFRWSVVEPQDDQFVWYDAEVQRAAPRGITIMGTIMVPWPSWADNGGLPNLNKWQEFVSQIVNHYKPWVKYWEIDNEPNYMFPPNFYAQMLKMACDAIEANDPQAKIIAMGGTSLSFMQQVIAELEKLYPGWNWKEHLYAFSTHAYPGGYGPEQFKTGIIDTLGEPVWNTETGAWDLGFYKGANSNFISWGKNLYPFKDAERYYRGAVRAVEAVVTNFLRSIGEGMSKYFYYDSRSAAAPNYFSSHPTIMEHDDTVRAKGIAYTIAGYFIDHATSLGNQAIETNTYAYLFERSGIPTLAIWTKDLTSKILTISLSPSQFKVYDIMGNLIPISGSSIPYGRTPIYIQGQSISVADFQSAIKAGSVSNRVDSIPPNISISQAPRGPVDNGSLRLRWIAIDSEAIPFLAKGFNNNPNSILYSYRIVGKNEAWSPWSTTSYLDVNLPSGNYTFEVKAKDEAGNESEVARRAIIVGGGSNLLGDISGDNQISAYDAALAAQYSVGLISLTQEQIQKAEVSGDKQVTAYDAALIAQRAVGLIGKFPVEG